MSSLILVIFSLLSSTVFAQLYGHSGFHSSYSGSSLYPSSYLRPSSLNSLYGSSSSLYPSPSVRPLLTTSYGSSFPLSSLGSSYSHSHIPSFYGSSALSPSSTYSSSLSPSYGFSSPFSSSYRGFAGGSTYSSPFYGAYPSLANYGRY